MAKRISRRIRQLAEQQHGVVARWQLLALGLSSRAIDGRIADDQLIPLYAGVYAIGHRVVTGRGYLMAAVLACGPSAVLSHKSAGSLWEIVSTNQARVDVTIPGAGRRSQPGIRVHRARRLHSEDITTRDGIPVTSVARTIHDLAGVQRPPQLVETIEQADREQRLNIPAIQRAIDRRSTVKGTRHLRRIVADYTEAPDTRSRLERRFLRLVTDAGLRVPQLNVTLAGFRVDAYWPQWQLAVELDGRGYHWTRASSRTTGSGTLGFSASAAASCASPRSG
jgi:hypothetical protein